MSRGGTSAAVLAAGALVLLPAATAAAEPVLRVRDRLAHELVGFIGEPRIFAAQLQYLRVHNVSYRGAASGEPATWVAG